MRNRRAVPGAVGQYICLHLLCQFCRCLAPAFLPRSYQLYGPLCLMAFLFVGNVMMFNLLVALLSSVYDENRAQARNLFVYELARTVRSHTVSWNQRRTLVVLPAPLSAVSFFVLRPAACVVFLCGSLSDGVRARWRRARSPKPGAGAGAGGGAGAAEQAASLCARPERAYPNQSLWNR